MKRQTSNKKTTLGRETHKKRKPKRRPKLRPELGVVTIPGVAGKKVDELLVDSSDVPGIDLYFDDESGVSFEFVTKLQAEQTDGGKADIWRPVKRWAKPKGY